MLGMMIDPIKDWRVGRCRVILTFVYRNCVWNPDLGRRSHAFCREPNPRPPTQNNALILET